MCVHSFFNCLRIFWTYFETLQILYRKISYIWRHIHMWNHIMNKYFTMICNQTAPCLMICFWQFLALFLISEPGKLRWLNAGWIKKPQAIVGSHSQLKYSPKKCKPKSPKVGFEFWVMIMVVCTGTCHWSSSEFPSRIQNIKWNHQNFRIQISIEILNQTDVFFQTLVQFLTGLDH